MLSTRRLVSFDAQGIYNGAPRALPRVREKNVVLLELDFPRRKEQSPEIREQNKKLAEQFGIRGYPTILFLDPRGNKLGKTGYVKGGPAKWIEKAKKEMQRD